MIKFQSIGVVDIIKFILICSQRFPVVGKFSQKIPVIYPVAAGDLQLPVQRTCMNAFIGRFCFQIYFNNVSNLLPFIGQFYFGDNPQFIRICHIEIFKDFGIDGFFFKIFGLSVCCLLIPETVIVSIKKLFCQW